MAEEYPYRYFLDFTWLYLGTPTINETQIIVPVFEFSVDPGFPGYEDDVYYDVGTLVFNNVAESSRIIYEYSDLEEVNGELRKRIKSKYTIIDGPFRETNKDLYLFVFEGVSKELNAWVHWEILMAEIIIEGEGKKRD